MHYDRILKVKQIELMDFKYNFIDSIPSFKKCTNEERIQICTKAQIAKYKTNDIVVKQGEFPDKLIYIMKGKLIVV